MDLLVKGRHTGNTEMSKASNILTVIKVALYIVLFIIRLLKVGLKYLWYRIVFYIKWRVALRKTREILRSAGMPTEEAEAIAFEITGPPPSLRKMIKSRRRFRWDGGNIRD